VNRREVITLLNSAVAAWPVVARAQQSVRQRHVGVLMTGSPDTGLVMLQALKARLSELGWVEGKTVTIGEVWAEGRLERFPRLAAQLIQQRPDVIVAPTTTAVLAVRHIAPDIPTVFLTVADAVGSGLIHSYARPGGSATGIQGNVETLPGKQIELLREIVPAANRIAILVNVPNPSTTLQKRNAEAAAVSLGLTLLPASISSPDEIETAFDQMRREGVQAVIFPTDATVTAERKRIARLAMDARLPSIFPFREQARDGGLLSYGFDLSDNYRRAADFVHKILSGAKAADLPVEFPTRLYLGVNLGTAKALGLTIPESFLLRADEVIE
jgi:putative tryptophan/tyrosine transport system substrate-binding protein